MKHKTQRQLENRAVWYLTDKCDRYQCQGLGTELLKRLLQVGRDEHLTLINAEILTENSAMQRVCEKLGFRIYPTAETSVVRAEMIT
ncbi:MAG: GNAT family N-acetyltransferase [Nostoc sp. EfeVER01]|uniref:GNAT family N-acetyltransferase n=1 Tax=Nostoc sp. EfeVER01 TaxID=3075406 RepID=UPI002AD49390|nr:MULTISPECIES: GNAT family N-acetyltransferase [unclassified Nostoc]MDZ7947992.1 GNAT family N-acetyltransferase [Nostoc sp. EfeVER01]MDZ7991389.1 GNAT family N-acetyltransferase [Nostoc sp. EspVER01]